ncbi:GNAT family N-acetyltransferase [Aeromonas hydrophila]|uniref:GNAT family N-acetyltransferase n=1 Tax=Aeromonas hydrophila TaxID=644 RepID=UPI002B49EB4E|nr:GNAT family N-acetyltransferase [Aeromonas hydrophila]
MEFKAKTISFRLIDVGDAEFILSLRTDGRLNRHLSQTSSSLEQQRDWIKNYKERENQGDEYYFIIYRNDNNEAVGTVRLYDFIHDKKSFCWGSWILNENKTKYAAMESAFLVYQIAFEKLGFERAHFDVRRENVKVIAFHQKMGAEVVSENDLDLFFEIEKNAISDARNKLSRFL